MLRPFPTAQRHRTRSKAVRQAMMWRLPRQLRPQSRLLALWQHLCALWQRVALVWHPLRELCSPSCPLLRVQLRLPRSRHWVQQAMAMPPANCAL